MNEQSEKKIDPLFSIFVRYPVILAEVGKRIEEIRIALGKREGKKKLSADEFGQRVGGVSHTSVGRWESGEVLPDSETTIKIVDLDPEQRGVFWLFGGEEAMYAARALTESAGSRGSAESRKRIQAAIRAAKQIAQDLERIASGPTGRDNE